MKITLISLIICLLTLNGTSQTITEYYKDKHLSRKSKKPARYKVVYGKDSKLKTKAVYDTKKDLLLRKIKSNGEQIGKWNVTRNRITTIADYDFELKYTQSKCELKYENIVTDSLEQRKSQKGILNFLMYNLSYPRYATEQGISGSVYIRLEFDKNGKLLNSSIEKSVTPCLDKEALRAARLFYTKNNFPLKTDKSYCHTMPVAFVIE